jgi:Glycosyl transferase family 90
MLREERQCVTAPSTCSNRSAARTMLVGHLGFAPIVWNLNSARHNGAQLQATKAFDVPWYEKKNSTLWRGAMTGFLETRQDASDLEQCLSNTRCRFVYESRLRKSSLIDAGLSWIVPHYKGGTYFNGIELNATYTQFQEFLKYKVNISLEGNDVSSGLKWNLLSNSVVSMPPPTKTSWAMELLLEPWVHYVPLFANLSNVEDRIRWVLENDYFAKQIATRSTMFMEDLWFSDDAKRDDKAVKYGILKRYQKLWQ